MLAYKCINILNIKIFIKIKYIKIIMNANHSFFCIYTLSNLLSEFNMFYLNILN